MAESTRAQDISDEEKSYFEIRVKQKVEEFQNALSNIVNVELRDDIRKENVTNLLKLFMGEGEPYDYYDEEADTRVHSTGVKMHTLCIYKTNNQLQQLKRYIYKLYNPETGKSSLPYSKISLEAADALRIENIQNVGNHYECIAYYTQRFIGYRDGKVALTEKSMKKIKCYMQGDSSVQLPSGKRIYPVLLGDIYVLSTKKL